MPADATLGVLLLSGSHDRAHYAFVVASGAAALGRQVVLFATNRGCIALCRDWSGIVHANPADTSLANAGAVNANLAGTDPASTHPAGTVPANADPTDVELVEPKPIDAGLIDAGLIAANRGNTGLADAERDARVQARGVAGLDTLRDACLELGVRMIACEAGLRSEALDVARLLPQVEVAGIATFLSAIGTGQIITI